MATGTGVTPFVAFARSGIRDFVLLHGVRTPDELYYQDELSPAADRYVPCISTPLPAESHSHYFAGRVTRYLTTELRPGRYDFYLCGRKEMIRDTILIIDDHFEGSRVFTEIFF